MSGKGSACLFSCMHISKIMFDEQGIRKTFLSVKGWICVPKYQHALLWLTTKVVLTWVCCRWAWHGSSGRGEQSTSLPLISSRIQRLVKTQRQGLCRSCCVLILRLAKTQTLTTHLVLYAKIGKNKDTEKEKTETSSPSTSCLERLTKYCSAHF